MFGHLRLEVPEVPGASVELGSDGLTAWHIWNATALDTSPPAGADSFTPGRLDRQGRGLGDPQRAPFGALSCFQCGARDQREHRSDLFAPPHPFDSLSVGHRSPSEREGTRARPKEVPKPQRGAGASHKERRPAPAAGPKGNRPAGRGAPDH